MTEKAYWYHVCEDSSERWAKDFLLYAKAQHWTMEDLDEEMLTHMFDRHWVACKYTCEKRFQERREEGRV